MTLLRGLQCFLALMMTIGWRVSAFADSRFQNCEPEEAEVLQNYEREAFWVSQDIRYQISLDLQNKEKLSSHRLLQAERSLRLNGASLVLECAANHLGKLTYKCSSQFGNSAIARTYPIVGKEVLLSRQFFRMSRDWQVAILFHEHTHKCGTTDADYFVNESPRDVTIVPWEWIADTYTYWMVNGYCVPSLNCP